MATSNNVQAPDEEAAEWVAMLDGTFQQCGTPAGSQQNLDGLVKIFDGLVMQQSQSETEMETCRCRRHHVSK